MNAFDGKALGEENITKLMFRYSATTMIALVLP